MKKAFVRLLSLLLCILLCSSFLSCSKEPPETVNLIAFSELGNPSMDVFPEDGIARCPWDMFFYKKTL